MTSTRKITQLTLETRSVFAEIADEGWEFQLRIQVFAWALYDKDTIEPLFIHKDYVTDGSPYGIEQIRKITGKNVSVVSYEWTGKE